MQVERGEDLGGLHVSGAPGGGVVAVGLGELGAGGGGDAGDLVGAGEDGAAVVHAEHVEAAPGGGLADGSLLALAPVSEEGLDVGGELDAFPDRVGGLGAGHRRPPAGVLRLAASSWCTRSRPLTLTDRTVMPLTMLK
ncbi:hypothetical protein KJK32_47120 (plasmid) [Streptomyces sp. JCM17656]|nr:hypothetical protein KJK32_47120 [Streptomyces sp. JCM17656]